MEQANLLVNTHSAAIIIVLLLIVLVALGMCFSLQGRLNKLQKKYDFFTQGKEANIDVVLTDTLQELRAVQNELAALQDEHQKLHAQVQNCLQNIKIVRYDAFDAMGGEMSYSLLLTDANNKGIILTSIYGREESRCFAKDIDNGKSSYPLAEEEQRLLSCNLNSDSVRKIPTGCCRDFLLSILQFKYGFYAPSNSLSRINMLSPKQR